MLHQEGELLVCPYNTSHLIRAKRMITHLSKCRKTNLSLGLKICPMDATHHVRPENFEEHLEKCPKRKVVDVVLFDQGSTTPANPILSVEKIKELLPPSEENWDNDDNPSYDPKAAAASRNVIRMLSNAPRAERKAFHVAERRRLLDLQDKNAAEGPVQVLGRQNDDDSVRMPTQRSQAFVHAQRQNQHSNQ